MCGRLNLSDLDGIRKLMADIGMPLFEVDDFLPRYNIAPTSSVNALVVSHEENNSTAHWRQFQWGMPLPNGPLVINARSETVHGKSTFKRLLHQRALVPVNGYYEWQRKHKEKYAWHFEAANEPALALAAIWRIKEQEPQLVLLTTEADSCMTPVHHRMPIAVRSEQAISWLTGNGSIDVKTVSFSKRRVSHWVDNAKNQGPKCLSAPEDTPHTPDLFD